MDSESFASASYYTYLRTTANNQQFLHALSAGACTEHPDSKNDSLSWNAPSYSKYELSSPEVQHQIDDTDCLALKWAITIQNMNCAITLKTKTV